MVHLTAFAIPRAEYFRIRRAGQPQSQHRKIHYHERADEKILKVQSNAATKNANPRQQIGNIIYKKL